MRLSEVKTMKVNISKLITPQLKMLGSLFTDNGYEIRFVGGVVRDLLMNKSPKDVDLATNATPDEMIRMFEENEIKFIPTGLQHGTITAVLNEENYEITTLRVDTDTDGRHANVTFTHNWKKDAARRDLTFNAMSIDFDGTLYDYFNGVEDLKNNIARFVGNAEERIKEDYLRILRYFRFKGRLKDPQFGSETIKAIKLHGEGLKMISGERIWAEMDKILSGDHLMKILRMMKECDLDNYLSLSFDNLTTVEKVAESKNSLVVLAAMMNSINEVLKLNDRWKFSSEVKRELLFLVDHKFTPVTEKSAKELLVTGTPLNFVYDILVLQGKKALYDKNIKGWKIPDFPVNGNDLLALGFKPGKEFGDKMRFLKKSWIDSNYKKTAEKLLSEIK